MDYVRKEGGKSKTELTEIQTMRHWSLYLDQRDLNKQSLNLSRNFCT